jgi:hypothetical protein
VSAKLTSRNWFAQELAEIRRQRQVRTNRSIPCLTTGATPVKRRNANGQPGVRMLVLNHEH